MRQAVTVTRAAHFILKVIYPAGASLAADPSCAKPLANSPRSGAALVVFQNEGCNSSKSAEMIHARLPEGHARSAPQYFDEALEIVVGLERQHDLPFVFASDADLYARA